MGFKLKGVQLANISRTLKSMALTVGWHCLSMNGMAWEGTKESPYRGNGKAGGGRGANMAIVFI